MRIVLLALLLSGCSVFEAPEYHRERDTVVAIIELTDDMPADWMIGHANCKDGLCRIKIRKSRYPDCITHEIRHGFEGAFHGNERSDESCYAW